MSKSYGEAIYSAYRQDGILHVRAIGMKPYAQTKVTLEELPFLIFPPEIGLFFDTEGIASPVVLPFEIERAFINYPNVSTVQIVDKNGGHSIHIEERHAPHFVSHVDDSSAGYVVYRQIGTDHYLIAKTDALVIQIYIKVFGPDTYENCQKYVAEHSTTKSPAVNIIPGSLKAWIDKQPGAEPRFIVVAKASVEVDWNVEIQESNPQGFNPLVKLLKVVVQLPSGHHSNAIETKNLRYEEAPPKDDYSDVTLRNGAHEMTVKVSEVQ